MEVIENGFLWLVWIVVLGWTASAYAQEDGVIQKLHDARFSGNAATASRLNRQIPRPERMVECAGDLIARPSTTISGPGDPTESVNGGPQVDPLTGSQTIAGFGNDIHVRPFNPDSRERNQTIATDPEGKIYVVWQDDSLSKDYIQVYWSQDGGQAWSKFYPLHVYHTFHMFSVSLHIAFTYALNNPWNFASNPVQILILP
jgi:hypothetical protein